MNKEGYEDYIRQGFVDKMEKVKINNVWYCFQEMGEPGTCSIDISYYYATTREKQCFMVSFTIPYVNCNCYLPDEEEKKKCEHENTMKREMTNQMLSTFRFLE